MLSSSFSWITIGQWVGGATVCFGFFLPFVVDHTASRADTVFSLPLPALR